MRTSKFITLQVALPIPLRKLFDYLPPPDRDDWLKLKQGCRLKLPFGNRELIGIFMGFSEQTDVPVSKLRPLLEIIDFEPLIPQDVLALCTWVAEYYHHPIGEVLTHALPTHLRKGKPLKNLKKPNISSPESLPHDLNPEQSLALKTIEKNINNFNVFLLDGVTGSGKTEVYLQAMTKVLQKQAQVLVLIPEIGLTPQTLQRFSARFAAPSIVLHSGLTEKTRLSAWQLIQTGAAKIIIGTRSAVFSPFSHLGLIIIDEEHDLSFKQQDGLKYHARDLAIMRAHAHNIPIILGTATPSLETYYKATQRKFSHIVLQKRAGSAVLPAFKILDIRNQRLDEGISPILLAEISKHLMANNQVMLFLNRRGFSPVILCHSCGWMKICKRCDVRMTYHQQSKKMHCHHCTSQAFIPKYCEACKVSELIPVGMGTERLESVLQKHFPQTSIVRIDRDTTQRKGSIETLLNEIQLGQHQILIGTQMLAKGHHFPDVTLVAIIDADGGFFSSDFRAIERMGQLILQVAGRAGRVEKPGTVLIQTHYPDHPLLHQLFSQNYHHFAHSLLEERKVVGLPPFAFLALFRSEAYSIDIAHAFLQGIKNLCGESKGVTMLGPMPAPLQKRAGKFRAQLLLQAKSRLILQNLITKILPGIDKLATKPRVRWSIDIDPVEMF